MNEGIWHRHYIYIVWKKEKGDMSVVLLLLPFLLIKCSGWMLKSCALTEEIFRTVAATVILVLVS